MSRANPPQPLGSQIVNWAEALCRQIVPTVDTKTQSPCVVCKLCGYTSTEVFDALTHVASSHKAVLLVAGAGSNSNG